MLLENTVVRHLIIDRPPQAQLAMVQGIAAILPSVVLASPAELDWWQAQLGAQVRIRTFDQTYQTEVAGNIRDALVDLDGQPHDTIYVGFLAEEIPEAIQTRVGTILIGNGVGLTMPDIFLSDSAEAVTTIGVLKNGRRDGWLIEAFSTRAGGHSIAGSTGHVSIQPFLRGRDWLDPVVSDTMRIVIAGRYFPEGEARHAKHQTSQRLLHAKHGDRKGSPIARALGDAIFLAKANAPIDLIVRVPPKPSKKSDPLGDLLLLAAKTVDQARKTNLNSLIDLSAVHCIRDYGLQRKAGDYRARAENVRGAFSADPRLVTGKNVLIVDDVLTSGATIVEMAATLLAAGAQSVVGLPIAINQREINYDLTDDLPCPKDGCPGTMQMRFAAKNDGTFWGCDQWPTCKENIWFFEGLKAHNERNVRDRIVVFGRDFF